ncbi:MAG: acetylglutamate kinase [Candidatus Aenigmatarchaeota archaeon]
MGLSESKNVGEIIGDLRDGKDLGDTLEDVVEYLSRFSGATFVIKISGDLVFDIEVLESMLEDMILLNENAKINIVIVHGARKSIDNLMDKYEQEPTFRNGLRITDEETIPLVVSAYQQANHEIVWRANSKARGNRAIGLSGITGNLFHAERKGEELGRVGEIVDVNEGIVKTLLDNDYIPVVYPLGVNENGDQLNLNSDEGAGKLASALSADKYIVLTNVKGILRDVEDEESLISELGYEEAVEMIEDQDIIGGHMEPKVDACLEALEGGVDRAHIIKAERHTLLEEVLTSEGIGTMITRE